MKRPRETTHLDKRRLVCKQPAPARHCLSLNGKWSFEIPLKRVMLESFAIPKDLVILIMSFHGPVAWTPFVLTGPFMRAGSIMTIRSVLEFAGTIPGNSLADDIPRACEIKTQVQTSLRNTADHLFQFPLAVPCFTAAAGYILVASVFKLPPDVRRSFLVEDIAMILEETSKEGRAVVREVLHACFCVAFHAAASSGSKHGYDEIAHLYDVLRDVCLRASLRPFHFDWHVVSSIRTKSWPEKAKTEAICYLVGTFYWAEGAWTHQDIDWMVCAPRIPGSAEVFINLFELATLRT